MSVPDNGMHGIRATRARCFLLESVRSCEGFRTPAAGGGHSRSVSVQPPTADLQINKGNQLNGLMRERPAPHDKWWARNSCTFKFDWTGFSGRPQLSTSKPGDGLREGRKALPRIAWQVAKSIAPSASSSKSMTTCVHALRPALSVLPRSAAGGPALTSTNTASARTRHQALGVTVVSGQGHARSMPRGNTSQQRKRPRLYAPRPLRPFVGLNVGAALVPLRQPRAKTEIAAFSPTSQPATRGRHCRCRSRASGSQFLLSGVPQPVGGAG